MFLCGKGSITSSFPASTTKRQGESPGDARISPGLPQMTSSDSAGTKLEYNSAVGLTSLLVTLELLEDFDAPRLWRFKWESVDDMPGRCSLDAIILPVSRLFGVEVLRTMEDLNNVETAAPSSWMDDDDDDDDDKGDESGVLVGV
jgi:hypothetical protein